MKLLKSILIPLVIVFGWLNRTEAHPFYVSVTEIQQNPKSGSLEISIKIFVDDFERGLEQFGHKKLNLGDTLERPDADAVVESYINRNLNFEINGEKRPFKFLGKEVDGENLWVYVELMDAGEIKILNIFNYILCDVFDGQTNIVHFKEGKEVKSLILGKDNPTGKIDFEQ